MNPFHYAFKVKDLASTRKFYIELLGCKEGRSTQHWVDFNFFGHQLSAHVSDNIPALDYCGKVDGINVPIPHFGCIINPHEFEKIKKRLEAVKADFIVKPQKRYAGKSGEQLTLFVLDHSGNPLEFKCFVDNTGIFSS
ncbi:MAG: VOC family protein [Flavobacteriales bacterium]